MKNIHLIIEFFSNISIKQAFKYCNPSLIFTIECDSLAVSLTFTLTNLRVKILNFNILCYCFGCSVPWYCMVHGLMFTTLSSGIFFLLKKEKRRSSSLIFSFLDQFPSYLDVFPFSSLSCLALLLKFHLVSLNQVTTRGKLFQGLQNQNWMFYCVDLIGCGLKSSPINSLDKNNWIGNY